MRTKLDPKDLGDLLQLPKCAILATTRRDGGILLSPVWHEWRNSGFSIVCVPGDVKMRHIERDPSVTIIVAEDSRPYRGIELRGEARISGDNTNEAVSRMARRYLGEERGARYADSSGDETFQLLRIEAGSLRVWDFDDEPDFSK